MRRLIPAVSLCLAILSVASSNAQDLKVKSATAKLVELEWTGASGTAVLERSAGQTFQKIGTGEPGSYKDNSIDPFGTYQYRIDTGGKFSNVVTVGPPPVGVSNAAPAPKGSEYSNYGPATAVTLDENGDPVIAFESVDPNGDGDKSDTEIRFVRWDRAAYKWVAPVRVEATGLLGDQNVNPIALACDRASGTLAILVALPESVAYLTSNDHGATWKNASVPAGFNGPHGAGLVASSGQVFAVINAEDGATWFTGSISDSGSWKSKAIPAGSGWRLRNNTNISLATDSAGKMAAAFYEDQQEGDGHRYVFWRPDGSDLIVIAGSAPTDSPDISLSYANNKFVSLFAAQLDTDDSGRTIWYAQSSDGTNWSKPVKLPIDGPRSTNAPLSIAISSKGSLTAAFGANSGSGPAACNAPAVSRSTDGVSWTTCGLGKAASADFSPQPATLHVIEAPDDKAYVVWQEVAETRYNPGILVWRQK